MSHFSNIESRIYTVNFVQNLWLKTSTDTRSINPPTIEDIENFITTGIDDIGLNIAEAGYPVALLAERGYELSIAKQKNEVKA